MPLNHGQKLAVLKKILMMDTWQPNSVLMVSQNHFNLDEAVDIGKSIPREIKKAIMWAPIPYEEGNSIRFSFSARQFTRYAKSLGMADNELPDELKPAPERGRGRG